ncbi:anthranilate synthase, component I [Pseudooceanicola antarcticus]|uniref:Anthranilate synthase n=1 Tax=Pseudooceanicola antarcticus TaxID=1247613 RepID=A0A285JBC4_9RHOB|nr:anthranilate synthase [Pseudooceanicola antarcticus]PJE30876.1 anthranilate synthase [Pseudooceanicola antarcticus]SNY57570.1 anthranilate synthase, component I [Pseudooceanicola antarcticus]
MTDLTFRTKGGVNVTRREMRGTYPTDTEALARRLDSHHGVLLSSNYEYPGRYTRWDFGFSEPPILVEARGRDMRIKALNGRGKVLLQIIAPALDGLEALSDTRIAEDEIAMVIRAPDRVVSEEERSRAPSVFSVLRALVDLFFTDEDGHLGLYGAFGYDLAFQFEPIEFTLERPEEQRDLVLFLADDIIVSDHYSTATMRYRYEFSAGDLSTEGLAGGTPAEPFVKGPEDLPRGDHVPGEYAKLVVDAKESFRRGDLFEVVPGQVFYEPCKDSPSAIYERLKKINPAPFGFIMNLGEQEYLVGASPEMFVRVTGRRVETCPISGTIKRGRDAIEDSEQILALLQSKKDESELTMCSDVDRNDKSRVCEPGSVRVIGRRQIEMYSRLIHTVDHIEGRLREGMDSMDAFLSHAWAVTVTGAPKLWAMRFIEKHEKSTRKWYGGAVGAVQFNGDMNTGLTLRTIRIKNGVAEVRAGATLLNDSDPDAEEAETELKASAMRAAIRGDHGENDISSDDFRLKRGLGRRILLVDHEDSFVHTLANYFRQTGAKVMTTRTPVAEELLDEFAPDLVVLSPGPGSPSDFSTADTIRKSLDRGMALFGVCLGLQSICEFSGAELRQLDDPMHGKPSRIKITDPGIVFDGLGEEVTIGRYHSLYAAEETLPPEIRVTARSSDGIVMGIEHRDLPIAAVQFHPESIMSLGQDAGMRMIENVVERLGSNNK